jgi:hypothetical protein
MCGRCGRHETRIAVDHDRTDAAVTALGSVLAGRPLVSAERFTTAYRTCYTGPQPIGIMRPALAIGCYRPWSPAQPATVLAAESTTRARSTALRHDWLTRIAPKTKRALSVLHAPPVITSWYATRRLRDLAGPDGAVAAIDGDLRARLENKANFDRFLRQAGLPEAVRIPALRIDGALPSLTELRRQLGTDRVVVQAGADSGGRGTVIVTGEDDMVAAARLAGPYRVAAFIEGWSSNTTVLSVPDHRHRGGVAVYVDRPSHKAIAVDQLGIGPAKSAGNDWSRPWPAAAAARLVEVAVRVAEWAWATHRLAGLFGLDAILTPDGEVMPNEINCRNQGTTEVSGVNQQLRRIPPFVVAQLVVLLGGRVDWLGDPDTFNHATITSATTASHPRPFYAKLRLTGTSPARLPETFRGPGVYRLGTSGRLRWIRPGAHPADADADHGELLLANTPGSDIICYPGAEIATLEGVTAGPGRPFTGPSEASEPTLRFAAALRALFTPVPATRQEILR